MKTVELKSRAGELSSCFYCGGALPASQKEHIFNSCWGGSHKTSQLVCDGCNADFSRIDGVFGYVLKFVMNALAIRTERRPRVPEIVGKNDVKLVPGAVPMKTTPGLTVANDGERFTASIHATSKSEARRLALDGELEKELQRPLQDHEREQILAGIRIAEQAQTFGTPFEFDLETDLKDEYRSVTHTLLKCLGMFEPEFVKDPSSEAARRFACEGKGEWADFAVSVRQIISPVATFPRELENFNAVEIYFSRAEKKVIGVVTILGRIKRAVALSGYEGADGLMVVFERVGMSHLGAMSFVFEPGLPPVPMLQLDPRPPSAATLMSDSLRVIDNAISWDATTKKLFDGLDKIVRRHPTLDLEACDEIRSSLVEICRTIATIHRVEVDAAEVEHLLADNGLERLAAFVGSPSIEPNVQNAVAHAFTATVEAIRKKGKTAGSTRPTPQ